MINLAALQKLEETCDQIAKEPFPKELAALPYVWALEVCSEAYFQDLLDRYDDEKRRNPSLTKLYRTPWDNGKVTYYARASTAA